ncbi:MAG: NAD-dependent epimerase/dehydratase family protein, partial [Planctomycetes bacterium]|nr:NAD-dependent epimerase/dehydratase family protein [Planctomycetota bacterium]
PPATHVDVARRLLELGIGVFLEKPAALCAADVRRLGALAAERGLPFGVNHNHVCQPAFQRLLQRVQAGEIGRVEHVQVCWNVPLMQLDAEQYAHWMFRAPRNIVYEQGPHPFSQVHALVGRLVDARTTILSTRELLPGQVFHDRWMVAARGERGTAEVYLAFGQDFSRNTLRVIGTDGDLEADFQNDTLCGDRKTPWLEFYNSYTVVRRRAKELLAESRRVLWNYLAFTLGFRERRDAYFVGMRESTTAFHEAIARGLTPPTDAARAAEVMDWCDAVAEVASAESAKPLELPAPRDVRPGEVVVLGGTGFIGKRVIERLLERGVPTTCVVRRRHSLPGAIADAARDGRLRLLDGSLGDADALRAAVAGATTVIHLATGGGDDWDTVRKSMVENSLDFAKLAAKAGVKRLCYVSSVAALYTGPDGEYELADSPATDPKPDVRAVYARGKAAAERALFEFAARQSMELVVLRPGVVMGAGTPMQHSGLGLWARDNHCVGWGPGDHALPLVWVEDVAEALVRAALHRGSELDGRALNLSANPGLSAKQVVDELRAATGRDLHFHPRSLELSQLMEIGKWMVKRAGGRRVEFPSYRDLKARALAPRFRSNLAREVLGWQPVEEREAFLDACVRIYAPRRAEAAE